MRTTSPKRPATVIVASAGGRIVATAAETLARAAAAAQGSQVVVHETRPLAAGDEIGLGIFMFMIMCTICGYLTVTLLFTVAPSLSPRRRYLIIATMSVLVPAIAYLVGGLGFGTYEGSFGTILALIGVAALYVFVLGLITRLLQVLIGPPALFVSLAIFVFLNIRSLGATYTRPVLPGFWQLLNHIWIGAQTVDAERGILYFGGLGVGPGVLRLLAWTTVVAGFLMLPAARELEGQRKGAAIAGAAQPPSTELAALA